MTERRHLPTAPSRRRLVLAAPADEATDAARWRALLDSEHIRVYVEKTKAANGGDLPRSSMKLYFEVMAVNPVTAGINNNYFGRHILTEYVDRLRKLRA